MTTGHIMFLLVAEEMSISRAAERAHVTQQCASDHIKKLEQEYGIPLFERRPKLKLSQAGELVLRTLRQTNRLEQMMKEQLHEMKGESSGQITIGINPTRARIILPDLLYQYQNLFPHVKISCVLGDTMELGALLLKNELDLFIGVDTASHPSFLRRKLGRDHVFFLSSEKLLKTCLPGKALSSLKSDGIAFKELPLFPITRNLTASTLNHLIDHNLSRHDVTLISPYFISDYDTQIAMCGSGYTAAFCPSLMLKRVMEYNLCHSSAQQVHMIPIAGMSDYLRIDLVTHSGLSQPKFLSKLIDCIVPHVHNLYSNLESYNHSASS